MQEVINVLAIMTKYRC